MNFLLVDTAEFLAVSRGNSAAALLASGPVVALPGAEGFSACGGGGEGCNFRCDDSHAFLGDIIEDGTGSTFDGHFHLDFLGFGFGGLGKAAAKFAFELELFQIPADL